MPHALPDVRNPMQQTFITFTLVSVLTKRSKSPIASAADWEGGTACLGRGERKEGGGARQARRQARRLAAQAGNAGEHDVWLQESAWLS